jgi:hypothetical protein
MFVYITLLSHFPLHYMESVEKKREERDAKIQIELET